MRPATHPSRSSARLATSACILLLCFHCTRLRGREDDRIEETRRRIVATLRRLPAAGIELESESMSASTKLVSVVEDEDTIREMVCLALGKEGYRTESFGDGVDA